MLATPIYAPYTNEVLKETAGIVTFDELRFEMTAPTVWGDSSPVQGEEDYVELRGGRTIPTVEASTVDFERLKQISLAMSQRANTLIGLSEIDFPLPLPHHLEKIEFDAVLGCWKLPISPSGERRRDTYGRMKLPGVPNGSGLAHRTMYKVFFGLDSLPNERWDYLDHLCETKPCCNPRHLEKVTHHENTRRGRVKNHGIEPLL